MATKVTRLRHNAGVALRREMAKHLDYEQGAICGRNANTSFAYLRSRKEEVWLVWNRDARSIVKSVFGPTYSKSDMWWARNMLLENVMYVPLDATMSDGSMGSRYGKVDEEPSQWHDENDGDDDQATIADDENRYVQCLVMRLPDRRRAYLTSAHSQPADRVPLRPLVTNIEQSTR